ncbi:hypothetical protein IMZ48_22425, partial [Candidatus Bathyarchaeota archaeon]|nr:hypothetical protein [Candidatus Bathyarchaeota archaeon]
MINDLVGEHPPMQPEDVALASTLASFKVNRLESHLWAVSGIKFLIFDDTDIKQNGYDSDDEESMTRHALKMSMQTEDDLGQNSTTASPKGKGKGKEVAMPDDPQFHVDDTDIKENGYDSGDEEAMMEIALKMSMQTEDDLGQDSTATSSKSKGKNVAMAANPQFLE